MLLNSDIENQYQTLLNQAYFQNNADDLCFQQLQINP